MINLKIYSIKVTILALFCYSFTCYGQITQVSSTVPGIAINNAQQQNVSNMKGVNIYMPATNMQGYQQHNPNISGATPPATMNNPVNPQQQSTIPANTVTTEGNNTKNLETQQNSKQEIKYTNYKENTLKKKNNNSNISEWNHTTIEEIEQKSTKDDGLKYKNFITGK